MAGGALSDGMVSKLIGTSPLPKFHKIRQIFDNRYIADIPAEIASNLTRPGTLDRVKANQSIAIAVGSRGISNLAEIVKCVVDNVKSKGANPFIVPSMGSHGGATAEGQEQLIADYGVTAEAMGCPIVSSMETVSLGKASRVQNFLSGKFLITAIMRGCSDGLFSMTDSRGEFLHEINSHRSAKFATLFEACSGETGGSSADFGEWTRLYDGQESCFAERRDFANAREHSLGAGSGSGSIGPRSN